MSTVANEQDYTMREGVGMIIRNRGKGILVGLRAGTDMWQLPQGGRDHADDSLMPDDAIREMHEELGILREEVTYIGTLPRTTSYLWPEKMRKQGPDGTNIFDGQRHHWLVFDYLPVGKPSLIKALEHEFDVLAWQDLDWLIKTTPSFRVDVYTEVRAMYREFTAQ